MPHNLSINIQGQAELALAKNDAWHKLGTVFDHLMTLEEAIEIACPWNAIKEQLSRPSTGELVDRYGIFRSDTGNCIGTVGNGYSIIQPIEMFSRQFQYESAGALFGGSVLFCSAIVGEMDILGSGDIHKTYLAFLNSFDGSLKAQQYLTGVRIVCKNTVQMSLRDKKGVTVSYKHTKNVHQKIDEARLIMESAIYNQQELQAQMEMLATKKLTKETYEVILDSLFPNESTKTNNVKKEITDLFVDNDNDTFPDWKGTAYSLFNSITNYVDHTRTTRTKEDNKQQARFESAILGSGATLKDKALHIISRVAETLPVTTTYTSIGAMGRQMSTMVLEPQQEENPVIDITSLDISNGDRSGSDTPALDSILSGMGF